MKMVSVVIPTHNRCETLKKAISGYQAQSALQEISEIIVVDDGSTDLTKAVVSQMAEQSAIAIRYFRQENKGPAAARNLGIRMAESPLILFTDDDIIPGRDLVAEHLNWHTTHPAETTAVLGFVTWSPDLDSTPFMEWYGSEVLFSFSKLRDQVAVDYRYFYTCNISLKRDFLCKSGTFDEDFKVAAFEDIELGFRLHSAGMRLLYNSQAIAYHKQFVSFNDACKRYRKTLATLPTFSQKDAGRQWSHLLRGTSPDKKRLKRWLAPFLYPLKWLMDWRIPLPWSLYRTMFRIYR
jgi:glycosyltransferase involved in cell wall biosynthesis